MTMYRAMIAAIALSLLSLPAQAQRPDSAMVGAWSGLAHITVDWTQQKMLAVRVSIYADGSITGTVGDAALIDARMRTNRTVLERAARLGSDYIIEAELGGAIIRAEGIQRASVRIPLNWKDGVFSGSIATSGSYDGGRETMKLMASELVLRRALPIISSIR
jgi:hypothetical protein